MSGPLLADKRPCLFCAGTSTPVSKCVVNEWGTANGNIGKSGVEAEAGSWMKLSRAYQTHANTIEVTAAVHPNGCQLMLSNWTGRKASRWLVAHTNAFGHAIFQRILPWHSMSREYPGLLGMLILYRIPNFLFWCDFDFILSYVCRSHWCFAYRFGLYIIYSIHSGPCHPKCLTLCGAYLFCSKINSRTIKRGQSKQAKNRRTGVAVALHAIVADWLQEEQR